MRKINFAVNITTSKLYAFLLLGLSVAILCITKEAVEAVACASVGAGLMGLKTYTSFKGNQVNNVVN